jgi:LacI family transcriptional regulator
MRETTKRAQIALLIDTSTTWGAGLIQGIADNGAVSEHWQFFLEPRGKYERLMLPESWEADGVIARVTHTALAEQIIERGIPAVNVSWFRFGESAIPQCTCDETAAAELAVNYFVGRGFRQFAYCGSSIRSNYVDRFREAFEDFLRRQMYCCHSYAPQCDPQSFLSSAADLQRLTTWLQELPKPIGLLAFDSVQARQVAEACRFGNVQVPHEVAILGGEHDLLSCTIAKPQLSSIDQAPQQVGFEAAALLSRLMAGEAPPNQPICIPPRRVITHQSTDVVAVDDDLLSAAAAFIKTHSHERIQVSDILRAVPISRRALEKGFRKWLNRSPAEEIRRVRVDHAVQLLCDTSWQMPRIATAAGFDRPELLSRAFRRELNTTPSDFRKKYHRSRDSQGSLPRSPDDRAPPVDEV